MTLKEKLTGRFIVLDGPDGSGKGTQIPLLIERLRREGLDPVRATDPGGTRIGDRIRSVLLDHDLSGMDVRCETLLFMASRAQLVAEVIDPALREGKVVVCDRFISSTCAYQGAAGYDVSRVIELGRVAVGNTWPSLTLILNVLPEEGFSRRGRITDAMEARPLDFHRRVHQIFLQLPGKYPGQVEVIDAAGTPEQVHQRIMESLERVAF